MSDFLLNTKRINGTYIWWKVGRTTCCKAVARKPNEVELTCSTFHRFHHIRPRKSVAACPKDQYKRISCVKR
jgi:hypothetical protein